MDSYSASFQRIQKPLYIYAPSGKKLFTEKYIDSSCIDTPNSEGGKRQFEQPQSHIKDLISHNYITKTPEIPADRAEYVLHTHGFDKSYIKDLPNLDTPNKKVYPAGIPRMSRESFINAHKPTRIHGIAD